MQRYYIVILIAVVVVISFIYLIGDDSGMPSLEGESKAKAGQFSNQNLGASQRSSDNKWWQRESGEDAVEPESVDKQNIEEQQDAVVFQEDITPEQWNATFPETSEEDLSAMDIPVETYDVEQTYTEPLEVLPPPPIAEDDTLSQIPELDEQAFLDASAAYDSSEVMVDGVVGLDVMEAGDTNGATTDDGVDVMHADDVDGMLSGEGMDVMYTGDTNGATLDDGVDVMRADDVSGMVSGEGVDVMGAGDTNGIILDGGMM